MIKKMEMCSHGRYTIPMKETKKSRYNDSQRKWTNNYKKKAYKSIAFGLSKLYEAELIEIYDSIPNKAEWFKECLREYKRKNT